MHTQSISWFVSRSSQLTLNSSDIGELETRLSLKGNIHIPSAGQGFVRHFVRSNGFDDIL